MNKNNASADQRSSSTRSAHMIHVAAAFAGLLAAAMPQHAGAIDAEPPPIPTGLTVPATNNDGSYGVSWNSSANATSYVLQERKGSGSWLGIYSGSATGKAISGKSDGTYSYRVRACKLSGSICSNWSASRSVTVEHPPPVPSLTVPSTDYNGAYTVDWSTSSGADKYQLHERFNSGSWYLLYSGSATSKSRASRSPGTWSYRVRACHGTNCSSWSATRAVNVPPPPAAPGGLTAPSTDYNGAYTVSWNASSGASSYRLQEGIGTTWTQVYSGTSTSRSLSGHSPGTYSYRARACNAESVCGGWSSVRTVEVPPPPPTPTGLTAPTTDYNGSYTVSWNASSGAFSYQLEEQSGTTWTQVYSGSSRSHLLDGRSPGAYSYRVRACHGESVCSTWSSTRTVTAEPPPTTPTGLNGPVTTECGAYTLSWSSAANASSYQLEEWPGADPWVQIYDDDALNTSLAARGAGTYSYRVRACNVESVCSAWSAPQTLTVLGVPDDSDNDCVADATDAYPSDPGRNQASIVTTADGTSFSFSMMLKLECDCAPGSVLEYRLGSGLWQAYRKLLVFDATTSISTRIRSQDENGTAQTTTYTRTLPAN